MLSRAPHAVLMATSYFSSIAPRSPCEGGEGVGEEVRSGRGGEGVGEEVREWERRRGGE